MVWLKSYFHAHHLFPWLYYSCDGGCLRSFHLTEEHGEASKCPSLGLTSEQAKVPLDWVADYLNSSLLLYIPITSCFSLITQMIIDKKDFICNNCKYKQHQCSACGLLGCSDLSSGAEVGITSMFDYVNWLLNLYFIWKRWRDNICESLKQYVKNTAQFPVERHDARCIKIPFSTGT
jgi:hypothetical protein